MPHMHRQSVCQLSNNKYILKTTVSKILLWTQLKSRHMPQGLRIVFIRHQASGIRHQASGIRHCCSWAKPHPTSLSKLWNLCLWADSNSYHGFWHMPQGLRIVFIRHCCSKAMPHPRSLSKLRNLCLWADSNSYHGFWHMPQGLRIVFIRHQALLFISHATP